MGYQPPGRRKRGGAPQLNCSTPHWKHRHSGPGASALPAKACMAASECTGCCSDTSPCLWLPAPIQQPWLGIQLQLWGRREPRTLPGAAATWQALWCQPWGQAVRGGFTPAGKGLAGCPLLTCSPSSQPCTALCSARKWSHLPPTLKTPMA